MSPRNKNPLVPNSKSLSSVQKLCDFAAPYENNSQSDQLFLTAMNEINQWHRQQCNFYAKYWQQEVGGESLQLKNINDCTKIPMIHANFFKSHEILSINPNDVYLHLTSSGTTGQKSQIFFDEWTLCAAQRMVQYIFEYYGWNTPEINTNYLLFSYEPRSGYNVGTSFTDNYLCEFAKVNTLTFGLKNTGLDSHEFDVFGVIDALIEYEKQGLPVRIFGFPSFMYFTLERMKHLKVPPIKLHPDSLVFFGGGWKGHADKQIEKHTLYKQIEDSLGIPNHRIRDGFGSVEHCVPYIECKNHEFHVPLWSRVFIRDVKTLEPLNFGEIGYLNFVSPYITSAPAQSVLMGDLASLHRHEDCSCELQTPFFRIQGRAGLSRNKSCAIAASELLKGKSV